MPKITEDLPDGTILVLHEGEYSDKDAHGPFLCLQRFNLDALERFFKGQWEREHPEDWDTPDPSDFLSWLHTAGWITDIPNVAHYHIGSYGRVEINEQ